MESMESMLFFGVGPEKKIGPHPEQIRTVTDRSPTVTAVYSNLSLVGTLVRGTVPRNLACGGRLCVLERWPSQAEEVPDCSGLNDGVISNPPPPVKLGAGLRGTGEPSREWGGSEVSQNPVSPTFRGGLSGNGMLPDFLQHLPPPVGACGERN